MEEKGADWTVFFFNAESFIIETNPTLLLCTNVERKRGDTIVAGERSSEIKEN